MKEGLHGLAEGRSLIASDQGEPETMNAPGLWRPPARSEPNLFLCNRSVWFRLYHSRRLRGSPHRLYPDAASLAPVGLRIGGRLS